jgi:GcrA cell cycle regulator
MPLNNMAGPIAGLWPEEHAQELTRLVASGMVYRLIAESLNEKFGTAHTKNAIVGKVQRLNLTPPAKEKRPPYVRKPKRSTANKGHHHTVDRIVRANGNSNAMRVIKTVELEQYKLRCVEIECTTTFDDVTGCRYPVGDGPFLFCNGAKTEGSSYCLNHHILCHDKPRVPIYRFVGRAA